MHMIVKGFDMVYYLDQMLMKDVEVYRYNSEPWAPLNTTHYIEDHSFPKKETNEKYYWCFQEENNNIYCLGLYSDYSNGPKKAELVYKSEFHNVTNHIKELINGR